MHPEAGIPLFSIFCYAVLGTMVARKRPLSREGRLFLGYILIVMLWSLGSFMVRTNTPIGSTLFWNYFLALWPPLVAVVYYHFVKVFLRKTARPVWLFAGYFYFLIYVFALTRGYVIEQAYISEGTYNVHFGLGFFILVPIAYCFLGTAIFWLVKEFRSTKDTFIRNRAGYLLLGISIVLILTCTNFIPALARYPIDQLGNVINALLIGYAILKYRLLDIKVIIRKGFLYSALTGLIVAVYFIVATLLQAIFQTHTGYVSWISILVIAILIAVLFPPLYQAAQQRLDRLFDRKKYDYRQMLRNSSQTIASTINLDELLMWILNDVSLTLGVEKINMLLYDSERQVYCLRRKRGCDHLHIGALYFGIDSPLVKYLVERNSCLTADDIDRLPRFRALWKLEREGLQELDATILVPLMAQTELIGILVLGSKKSDEPYTSDDIDLLSTLSNQAATAVRNAQLYEKSEQAYKELQEAQERLIRSERLKALGELTSGVAHDFNNVLSTILGRAQLSLEAIQKGEQEDGKIKSGLELIEQAALDATGIVRRLQDFARVRTDHDLDVVDLNDVLRSALEMIKPRLDEQRETQNLKNEVVLNLDETGLVEGNASELKESLVNILINAIEAMPQGGKLTVESKLDGDFTVITISDTGIGMTSEVKQDIFEPFFTTKGLKGSGMGLSVVYGIISRHNGQINVSSQLGKGSTFMIKFPVTTKSKKDIATEFNRRNANNATILIVEDDGGPRDVLYELLSRAGHKVDTAYNGENGFSLFQQKHYDLVVADLGMPDISGLEVASTVKTNNPETKVILVTGWGIQLDTKDLERQGVDSVIAKPFDIENVLATVDRLLSI